MPSAVMHDFQHVPVALSFFSRIRGLIGRRELFLFIPGCTAVHTWFMRGAIDLVFLDEREGVVAIRANAAPWHFFFGPRGTRSVLELPPGHAASLGVTEGDQVSVAWP